MPIRFDVRVEDPNSNAGRLVVRYLEGPPLDDVDCELIIADDSPLLGFGIGSLSSTTQLTGAMRVGEERVFAVVQRARNVSDGPAWASGRVDVRLICKNQRRQRDVGAEAVIPPQPWAY